MAKFVIKSPETIHEKLPTNEAKNKAETHVQPEGLFKNAKELLETFGNAKVGRKLFGNYAIDFQLRDTMPPLFYIFMLVTFAIDILEAAIVLALVAFILIAFVYVALRAVNAWTETVHITHVALHTTHVIFEDIRSSNK